MPAKNKLRLFDLTMIVTGLVIGMGIFRTSRDAASATPVPSIFFAAWIIGGLVALCGALTYAEIGSRYPVTGGYYRVFSYAFHPSFAFALNCGIIVSNAASVGGIALIGSGYILPLIFPGSSQFTAQVVAVASIVIFFLLNLKGLRLSSTTQNILMLIKITMLLLVISALFFPSSWEPGNVPLTTPFTGTAGEGIFSFGVCLLVVSFTYGGYQQTINFGNEVVDAQKNIPKGIIAGITLIITIYLLTNISYYYVIGYENLKTTSEIASAVIGKILGKTGATIFSLLLFLSVLAYVNVNLLSNPRVMFAMSEDGVLPKAFGKRNERNGVYNFSLSVFSAIAITVVFFAETFERILSFSMFLDCFGMAASAATIFVLRKRTAELDAVVYKTPFFPLLPILFIAAYIFLGIIIILNTPGIAIAALGVMLISALIYFLILRFKKSGPVNN